ncbi:hypothetical protein PIB30_060467 [Stylosanthes scabra]|uniref:Uncharacterized protein n=1 Tax=Stylosanthes scabra TaxID=79078 RepID=A0ABU6RKW3_9FABA|nr:hypothetical protein [Stylosanthes scabra]
MKGSRKDAPMRMHPRCAYASVAQRLRIRGYKRIKGLMQMTPKGKAKVHRPLTRFLLRLAALKTRQSRDKVEPLRTAPMNAEPIQISSDSESEEVPEYIPGTGQSDDEELEYIPED